MPQRRGSVIADILQDIGCAQDCLDLVAEKIRVGALVPPGHHKNISLHH